jgi:signal transduction histidine kinase
MPFGTGDLKFATRNIILNKEEAKQAKVHPGKFIILSISDTGIGMDKETQDHLFQPFFTTKAVGKGLGLGLASVRDCIKSHGGYIEFESSSGKGSDFRLIIPVVS